MRAWASWGAIALLSAASLALRAAFPVFAVGPAMYDDGHFVRLAEFLAAGQWLGPYDNLTLAKGAAYSAFLALNHALGLPLKITEHALYLACGGALCAAIGAALRSRAAMVACFALLAFNPVLWMPQSGGRVVREALYTSLSLLLVALAIRAFLLPRGASTREELRAKRGLLVALGLVGAIYWLTREEGAWLVPSLAIACMAWVGAAFARERRRALGPAVAFLGLPLATFLIAVAAVDAANYAAYGVFRNNDFRDRDFPAAYGALSRISHERWQRYVPFPKDAREKAYAASAAARELQPYFEGAGGEFWRSIGCSQTRTDPCPEILSGWFMWALRDAAAQAGHYANAREARAFYRRLAREVNAACDRGTIPCGPPRASLVPPWHERYFGDTLAAGGAVLATLLSMDPPQVGIDPSIGTPQQLEPFRLMTNAALAKAGDEASAGWRLEVARGIAVAQGAITPLLFGAALVAWVAALGY